MPSKKLPKPRWNASTEKYNYQHATRAVYKIRLNQVIHPNKEEACVGSSCNPHLAWLAGALVF